MGIFQKLSPALQVVKFCSEWEKWLILEVKMMKWWTNDFHTKMVFSKQSLRTEWLNGLDGKSYFLNYYFISLRKKSWLNYRNWKTKQFFSLSFFILFFRLFQSIIFILFSIINFKFPEYIFQRSEILKF